MTTEQYIWYCFDTAIADQFLANATLPHADNELSQQLSLFWQQATSPKVQVMKLLITHELFNNSDSEYETKASRAGVEVAFNTGAQWFAARLSVGVMGISVAVFAKDTTVWSDNCHFNSQHLRNRTNYEELLHDMITKVTQVSRELDAAIKETINKY
ncbi:MAG: hypothetical protein KGV50_00230 [Gammaproteobacteria bacterium]|nr:hypothetical protein [Gammaproteobacteria bacterium]